MSSLIIMKWVTRWHLFVDRVACPWLISKFVDKDAEFVFVPWPGPLPTPDMGIPFDFPDSGFELGHHGVGPDEKCSFEAIIKKYNIEDPWVLEVAKIVHAADVEQDIILNEKSPEARGLWAISEGTGYMVDDEYEALEKAFFVYDALYVYVQVKKIREEYKDELSKMDDNDDGYFFIHSRIKKPPECKLTRNKVKRLTR